MSKDHAWRWFLVFVLYVIGGVWTIVFWNLANAWVRDIAREVIREELKIHGEK